MLDELRRDKEVILASIRNNKWACKHSLLNGCKTWKSACYKAGKDFFTFLLK